MPSQARFRQIALGLPEAVEADHLGRPSFRVGQRIFATLWPDEERGVLKFTPALQAEYVARVPEAFASVTGAWGRQGYTSVFLEQVSEQDLRTGLEHAWRSVAPKRLPGPGSTG